MEAIEAMICLTTGKVNRFCICYIYFLLLIWLTFFITYFSLCSGLLWYKKPDPELYENTSEFLQNQNPHTQYIPLNWTNANSAPSSMGSQFKIGENAAGENGESFTGQPEGQQQPYRNMDSSSGKDNNSARRDQGNSRKANSDHQTTSVKTLSTAVDEQPCGNCKACKYQSKANSSQHLQNSSASMLVRGPPRTKKTSGGQKKK